MTMHPRRLSPVFGRLADSSLEPVRDAGARNHTRTTTLHRVTSRAIWITALVTGCVSGSRDPQTREIAGALSASAPFGGLAYGGTPYGGGGSNGDGGSDGGSGGGSNDGDGGGGGRCVCTSAATIWSYNHCRAESVSTKPPEVDLDIALSGPLSWTGTWTGADALRLCNTDAWKASAIIGMRQECKQGFWLKEIRDGQWNDWCRTNWPNDIAKYFRWTYRGSLRKDCDTAITPEKLTCTVVN